MFLWMFYGTTSKTTPSFSSLSTRDEETNTDPGVCTPPLQKKKKQDRNRTQTMLVGRTAAVYFLSTQYLKDPPLSEDW